MPRITIPASQMSRLAMTIAGGGDGTYDKAYSQELMSQSSIGKAIEEANLARQKAQQFEDQNASRQPDAVLDNALVGFGIPIDARDDVKNVIKTGQLPDKYQPLPPDQSGPVLPKPGWMDKIGPLARQIMTVQNALTLGDKNVENVAKAYGTYDNINKQDQVINGSLPASSLGRAVAASKGMKLVDNIGDTGQGYDLFSGQGVTLDQGLRDVFGNKANAQIRKENAQAGAANASAAHSLASRDKVRQDIEMGSKGVLVDTDQGKMLVDPRSGSAKPVTDASGNIIGPRLKEIPHAANTAIITNAQNLSKVDQAIKLLSGQKIGDVKGDKNATGWKGYLPNSVLNRYDPEGVDTRAAVTDLGSMILHDRSGAAVTVSEYPRLAPFIPLPTDDPASAMKKLKRFKQIYEQESSMLADTYSPANGYRGSPVLKPTDKTIVVDY